MTSIIKVDNIQDSGGTAAISIDSSGNATFPNRYPKVAVIADQKLHSEDGGSPISGWNDRDLNTEIFDPDGIVSISSNQFTLGAGSYIIEFSAPAYRANRHVAELYNVTDSTTTQTGSAAYSNSAGNVQTDSTGCAYVSITGNTTYKIRHNLSNAQANNGLGVRADRSTIGKSIYTTVKITKIAG